MALLAFSELTTTDAQKLKIIAKQIAGLGGFGFLYAAYTILTLWSIGVQSFGGITGGAETGPGVWMGLLGSLIVVFSQAAILASDQDKSGGGESP